jgi:hypothetical protein
MMLADLPVPADAVDDLAELVRAADTDEPSTSGGAVLLNDPPTRPQRDLRRGSSGNLCCDARRSSAV